MKIESVTSGRDKDEVISFWDWSGLYAYFSLDLENLSRIVI